MTCTKENKSETSQNGLATAIHLSAHQLQQWVQWVQVAPHSSCGHQADTFGPIDLIFGMKVPRYMWIMMHEKISIKNVSKWSVCTDSFECTSTAALLSFVYCAPQASSGHQANTFGPIDLIFGIQVPRYITEKTFLVKYAAMGAPWD